MRIAGSKNKPKTVLVKLSDLNSLFREDALIEVSLKYGSLFQSQQVIEPEIKENEESGSISFTVNS
jgi:hypothetical protein